MSEMSIPWYEQVRIVNRDTSFSRLHNVKVGTVDDINDIPPDYDSGGEAASEVEINMQECGFIEGVVGTEGVVNCPTGVTGSYLVVQIAATKSQCAAISAEQSQGCMLTLCEVYADTGDNINTLI